MMTTRNRLYLLVGPSGVGKNTLVNLIIDQDIDVGVATSMTTRAPRQGEEDGVDYHFVNKDHFEDLIKSDMLLQYVSYAGNYYGLGKAEVDNKLLTGNTLVVVEPDGVRQLKGMYPDSVSVYLNAPPQILMDRMRKRGDSEGQIATRMRTHDHFMQYLPEADHIINQDSPEDSLKDMFRIMEQYN